jgi:outer membrane biosynthesis protein TonB
MTNARSLAFIASISIAVFAFGPATEARAERRQPLSSAQIRQVMSQHAPAVRECYVQHAMQQQGSMGSLTLEILVRAGGQVAGIEVEAPASDDKKLEQCVSQLAKSWRFPRSSSQTLVKYPMMFVHTQAQGAGPAVPVRTGNKLAKKQPAAPGGRSLP